MTFNGGIKTSDCQSRHLELKSTIGSLFVNRCGGDKLKAEASNGSITLKESNWKELVAETMNGPVRLNGKSEQIRIETINGSIYYRLDTPASGYASLKTVTGKIEAELPESLEVEASLKTYVGGLVSDFDGMEVLEQKRKLRRSFSVLLQIREVNRPTGWKPRRRQAPLLYSRQNRKADYSERK